MSCSIRRAEPATSSPGLAVSPVFHQHRSAHRRSRHHPSPARDHRDRVRRPHRRATGPPSLGPVRGELRLDVVRGDRPQPDAGVLAGDRHARARGSTHRRRIVNVPARLARPQRRTLLHLPAHWPWAQHWLAVWRNTIGYSPPPPATPDHHLPNRPVTNPRERLGRPAAPPRPYPHDQDQQTSERTPHSPSVDTV
jgi:hypothetical protein